MHYLHTDHTFAVCAYKESPFLEELLLSLMQQTVKTKIIISTATPNDHIFSLAEKYNLPVFINEGEKGLTADWMYAVKCVDTPLVTIAHQDDTYEPTYIEKMLQAINHAKQPIIAFSHYAELRNGKKVYKNRLLTIKKWLLLPIKLSNTSIAMRRLSLSLGCAICCPAVTYVRDLLLQYPFDSSYIVSEDWKQWAVFSKLKGSFAYVDEPLVCHRIHEESTTTALIRDNTRSNEDYRMFCEFWPRPIAKLLAKAYASSEKSNDLDE